MDAEIFVYRHLHLDTPLTAKPLSWYFQVEEKWVTVKDWTYVNNFLHILACICMPKNYIGTHMYANKTISAHICVQITTPLFYYNSWVPSLCVGFSGVTETFLLDRNCSHWFPPHPLSSYRKLQGKKNRQSSDLWEPPSPAWASNSLGVRSGPPIVNVIHRCFNSEGHQIRG